MATKSTVEKSKSKSAKEINQDKQPLVDTLAKRDNHLPVTNTSIEADLTLGLQMTRIMNAKSITRENKNIAKEEKGRGHALENLGTGEESARGKDQERRVASITEENIAIKMSAKDAEIDSETQYDST